MKSFTCAGCGHRVTIKPGNGPFIWTDAETKRPSNYCSTCDDKLIRDQPLPKPKEKKR